MTIIADIYAQVPEVPCKGLCQQACGPIGCSGIEAQAIQDAGLDLPRSVYHPVQGEATCSHLTLEGRCGIYAHRPLVCRLFGAVKKLACPHGCTPTGGHMADVKGRAMVDQLSAASDAAELPPYCA
jgi:Fe-S-cluster containining protein